MSQLRQLAHRRKVVFFASLLVLAVTVGFTVKMISTRSVPDSIEEPKIIAPLVDTETIEKKHHTVRVKVYGTVRPEKSVSFAAPFSGTALAASHLFVGRNLPQGSLLYTMDTAKIDLSIEQANVKLKENDLEEKKLFADKALILSRIETAKELYQIAQTSFRKRKSNLEIETELFANAKALHERKTLSRSEFLEAEAKLNAADLAMLEARRTMENTKDSLHQLRINLNELEFSLSRLKEQRQDTILQREELYTDRTKAMMETDFPAQVMSVNVTKKEEVNAGSVLAMVRSIDAVELTVNIPDIYFRWLYAGEMLENPNGKKIPITLVNAEFRKDFEGGFIKSIGESVNTPTRSLPVVIGRKNPLKDDKWPILSDELKPGMYCQVTLDLFELEDVFKVPRSAIQSDNRLYHVEDGELSVVEKLELLHEDEEGVICRLPGNYTKLNLITHPLKNATIGGPVEVQKEG